MARLTTTLTAALLALGLASGARAQASTTTSGTAQVSEQAGIQATGEVIFQDIVLVPQVAPPPMVTSSGSTNVTVTGAGGDAVSLAVPQTFQVISTKTGQTVTMVTTTSGDYAAIAGLQTLLSSGGTLSVDLGGAIHITSDQLLQGEYEGLLVVVAQYN
ncbi:MAG TPA: hypothetical protein VF138_08930 [Caulobacteraceae bacterium]